MIQRHNDNISIQNESTSPSHAPQNQTNTDAQGVRRNPQKLASPVHKQPGERDGAKRGAWSADLK